MKKQSLICSSLLVLALTILVSASVQAQAFDPLRISGLITAYTPADCGKPGSITIAGQTLVIAAGADTIFFDTMQVILANGGLGNANVKSEVRQVVGTGRQIGVYLDSQNRIRLQTVTTINSTTSRTFDITGAVTAMTADSITIHGLTFAIAPGSTVAAVVDPSKLVRILGTLNSSNQLTGPVVSGMTTTTAIVSDPHRKITICGAPANYRSVGGFEVPDVNAFDGAGPIASEVFVFNPLGTAGGQFICDESNEVMTVDGVANIPVAPNFSMRRDISKDVNACFELNIDSNSRFRLLLYLQ